MSELVPSVENLYPGEATLQPAPVGPGPLDRLGPSPDLAIAAFHRDR